MKNDVSKVITVIFVICMMFLGSFTVSRTQVQNQNQQEDVWTLNTSSQSQNQSQSQSQNLDSGDHYCVMIPDGVLSTEPRSVSFVKTGRTEEECAGSVLFLLSIVLIIVTFQFLLDGRPWSAVQSICMEFQNSVMHQIQILKLWDGKRKGVLLF